MINTVLKLININKKTLKYSYLETELFEYNGINTGED